MSMYSYTHTHTHTHREKESIDIYRDVCAYLYLYVYVYVYLWIYIHIWHVSLVCIYAYMMGHDSGSHPDVMVKKGVSFVSISTNGPILCYKL